MAPKPPAHKAATGPWTRPVNEAMSASEPLSRLVERMQESRARFEALQSVLPASLLAHVQPGPLDAEGWSLVTANTSVAAKLRQCLPQIEQALADRRWQPTAIRIRVQSAKA